MEKSRYLYDIDDHPPVGYALLYGFQWAIIMFPALIIVATLSSKALHADAGASVRTFQLILLVSGLFTTIQSLWGHRYPLLDGPATAVLLTFIAMAPYGIPAIQGGTIFGGALLIIFVISGKLKKLIAYATPNVVGVILMLIALSLLPHLASSMIGAGDDRPEGSGMVFVVSLGLVILMAALSHHLKGFLKTIALLMGMVAGTAIFYAFDPPGWGHLASAAWLSVPPRWAPSVPLFSWPAMLAFGASYVAVIVNSLGSIHGIAHITDTERLPRAVSRGIFLNGAAGLCCGLMGIVGTVTYSTSPGVVLANRVASRYATLYGGIILMAAAFIPKLSALLSSVPAPVVGAALCVAMGAQIGAGLAVISGGELTARDYFVVGLPVLIGTLVGFLPKAFLTSVPTFGQVFLGNGLISGIALVLVLEHLLMRKPSLEQGAKE